MTKPQIDWEAIEPDWRAGIKTKQQMAAEYGVSRAAMDKHFDKLGIERDLTAKIKAKAESLVAHDLVTPKVTPKSRVTEAVIIESNAEAIAKVIRSHRASIGKYQSLCEKLFAEIELQTGQRLTFEQLGELMATAETDDKAVDKLKEVYRRTLSTPSRVESLKKLVDAFKTLVGLERQAFNLADNANGDADQKPVAPSNLPPADCYKRMIGL